MVVKRELLNASKGSNSTPTLIVSKIGDFSLSNNLLKLMLCQRINTSFIIFPREKSIKKVKHQFIAELQLMERELLSQLKDILNLKNGIQLIRKYLLSIRNQKL